MNMIITNQQFIQFQQGEQVKLILPSYNTVVTLKQLMQMFLARFQAQTSVIDSLLKKIKKYNLRITALAKLYYQVNQQNKKLLAELNKFKMPEKNYAKSTIDGSRSDLQSECLDAFYCEQCKIQIGVKIRNSKLDRQAQTEDQEACLGVSNSENVKMLKKMMGQMKELLGIEQGELSAEGQGISENDWVLIKNVCKKIVKQLRERSAWQQRLKSKIVNVVDKHNVTKAEREEKTNQSMTVFLRPQ